MRRPWGRLVALKMRSGPAARRRVPRAPRRTCAVCALRPPCPAAGPAPHSWRSLLGDWNPAPWMPLNKRFCSNGLDTPASARRVTALDSAPAPKGRPCVGRGAVATTGRERGRGARAPRPRKGGASRRPRGARVNASEAAAGAWTDRTRERPQPGRGGGGASGRATPLAAAICALCGLCSLCPRSPSVVLLWRCRPQVTLSRTPHSEGQDQRG